MFLLDTFFPSAVAGAAGVAGLLAVSPAICANARPGANANQATEALSAEMIQNAATRKLINLLVEGFSLEVVMVVPNLIRAESLFQQNTTAEASRSDYQYPPKPPPPPTHCIPSPFLDSSFSHLYIGYWAALVIPVCPYPPDTAIQASQAARKVRALLVIISNNVLPPLRA
jgi:hypothetical protein